MDQIRIVVVGMPRMLEELVRALASAEPGCEIVHTATRSGDLVAAVQGTGADILIAGAAAAPAQAVSALLDRWPRLRAIAIEGDGRRSVVYELRPHRIQLGELSPTTLRAALHRAPRPGWLP